MATAPLNIVLVHPEIPNNTGNIGRTAAATGCRLHVIHPIGFDMSEKARRRAGLDYWHLVDCREHDSWDDFLAAESPKRAWLFTTKAETSFRTPTYAPGDHLVFGPEGSGAPPELQDWFTSNQGADHRLRIPMVDDPAARSLNLATAVAIATYEALRDLPDAP